MSSTDSQRFLCSLVHSQSERKAAANGAQLRQATSASERIWVRCPRSSSRRSTSRARRSIALASPPPSSTSSPSSQAVSPPTPAWPQASPHGLTPATDVLVIPTRVVPRLSDLKQDELASLMASVQHVGRVIERVYAADGLTIACQVRFLRTSSQTQNHILSPSASATAHRRQIGRAHV